jgi:diguanylate cyclase (GGDEF)-like protein/PAS domain S-box-containing protein
VLLICNDEKVAPNQGMLSFNAEEAELLKELGANLAFGIGAIREQLAHRRARQLRIESDRRLSHLLAASPTILYALEHDGEAWRVVELTQNIERILGVTVETAMSLAWWENRIHPQDRNAAAKANLRVLQGKREVSRYRVARQAGEYRWIRDDCVLIAANDGQPARILGAWLDITEKKEAEAEIRRLAFFDSLTRLPNRRLMLNRLEACLSEARLSGQSGAVMLIDLDGFKEINDIHGHAAGDKVLEAVAERLSHGMRNTDTAARLGGDEFVVLMPELGDGQGKASARALLLAEKLASHIKMPIAIGDLQVSIGSSIGISLFPGHAVAPDELLRAADTAMYAAKAAARDQLWSSDHSSIAIFEPAMLAAVTHQHRIQAEIRAALAQNRFELWLQRQVDGSGKMTGAEALIRLRTGDGRLIPPLEFIPVAEASGLIVPIGQWIIAEAFSLLTQVHAVMLPRLSINISAIEFRQPQFVDNLLARLQDTAVDPDRLTIEITESLLIERVDETILKLQKLRDRGLRISIDDFGTGYSSLSYLQRLPISEIKIDRRFISEMLTDPRSAKVTQTLITVAQNMGFDVIAEGVETAEQAAFLQYHGCHAMQGFLFGWPEPAAQFAVHAG